MKKHLFWSCLFVTLYFLHVFHCWGFSVFAVCCSISGLCLEFCHLSNVSMTVRRFVFSSAIVYFLNLFSPTMRLCVALDVLSMWEEGFLCKCATLWPVLVLQIGNLNPVAMVWRENVMPIPRFNTSGAKWSKLVWSCSCIRWWAHPTEDSEEFTHAEGPQWRTRPSPQLISFSFLQWDSC